MKVATKTLASIMGLVSNSQGDKKTVTLTPGANAVTLTATSGIGSTRAKILAVTEEDGDIEPCPVPTQLLAALASSTDAELIEIKPASANLLTARAGAGNTSLTTSEPTDFPALEAAKAPTERTTFTMPLTVLAAGINRVQFAATKADKTAQQQLAMTQFQITADGKLLTAATDSRILSHSETPIPDWKGEPLSLLFPQTKALARLLDLTPEATAHVMVANNKILIVVKTEALAIELVLNTVDLPYPDWQKIRQQNKPTIIATAPLKAMRELMTRANAICPTPRVGIKLVGPDKKLVLGAKNETVQHVDAINLGAIMVNGPEGKPVPFDGEFVIYASPQGLTDALTATAEWTTADTVRLGFVEATRPFVINPIGYQYNHWIMPMVAEGAKPKETTGE
ncbi:MAG: hypothetical protein R6W76_12240 [Caldilinea sp.]